MSDDDLIEKGWTALAQQSLARASQDKLETCKAFFYAGVQHCLEVLTENDNIDDDELLESLNDELDAYGRRLQGDVNGGDDG
jgi:hypothetical protein